MDEQLESRVRYRHFLAIPTRWIDNDNYTHVNNAVYYTFFDTVVNEYLIREGGLDPARGEIIGLAVETFCRFFKPLSFPEVVDAGMRVGKLGNSSVRYEFGLFRQGEDDPAAVGYFVHVFVNRETRRPAPLPDRIRVALLRLVVEKKQPQSGTRVLKSLPVNGEGFRVGFITPISCPLPSTSRRHVDAR
jgi:acyl-CoA thioester hydrolase